MADASGDTPPTCTHAFSSQDDDGTFGFSVGLGDRWSATPETRASLQFQQVTPQETESVEAAWKEKAEFRSLSMAFRHAGFARDMGSLTHRGRVVPTAFWAPSR